MPPRVPAWPGILNQVGSPSSVSFFSLKGGRAIGPRRGILTIPCDRFMIQCLIAVGKDCGGRDSGAWADCLVCLKLMIRQVERWQAGRVYARFQKYP